MLPAGFNHRALSSECLADISERMAHAGHSLAWRVVDRACRFHSRPGGGHALFNRDPHREEPYSGTVREAVHRACASRGKIVIDLSSVFLFNGARTH